MGVDDKPELKDVPVLTTRELNVDELNAIRVEHDSGLHDPCKLICCPQCYPKP